MKSYFLITGASGGFGRAFSVALARKNFNLFLTDQAAGKLRLLADALMRTYGIEVKYKPCNLLEQNELPISLVVSSIKYHIRA